MLLIMEDFTASIGYNDYTKTRKSISVLLYPVTTPLYFL